MSFAGCLKMSGLVHSDLMNIWNHCRIFYNFFFFIYWYMLKPVFDLYILSNGGHVSWWINTSNTMSNCKPEDTVIYSLKVVGPVVWEERILKIVDDDRRQRQRLQTTTDRQLRWLTTTNRWRASSDDMSSRVPVRAGVITNI